MNIAGICVTYNPVLEDFENNLRCHAKILPNIFIIDNSDNKEIKIKLKNLCEKISNVKLITLSKNYGIARALNIGCDLAIDCNCDWVVTLDQDSLMPESMLNEYVSFLNNPENISSGSKIGMLTCQMTTWLNPVSTNKDYEQVKTCWTSGAFMNLKAYSQSGKFDEDLFIDLVDFDICYRMYLHNFIIFRLNNVLLTHSLGLTKIHKLLGERFYVTNHSPLRRYYMTRNSLYLRKKYNHAGVSSYGNFFVKILIIINKILFFEDKKLLKLKAMWLGWRDYKRKAKGEASKKIIRLLVR